MRVFIAYCVFFNPGREMTTGFTNIYLFIYLLLYIYIDTYIQNLYLPMEIIIPDRDPARPLDPGKGALSMRQPRLPHPQILILFNDFLPNGRQNGRSQRLKITNRDIICVCVYKKEPKLVDTFSLAIRNRL